MREGKLGVEEKEMYALIPLGDIRVGIGDDHPL